MNRICTICARGGSKGLPGKNTALLAGKPLIAHSIIQAKKSNLFKYIAVSSDSDEILKVSKEWGADILIKRPDELSSDTAPKVPVIRHALLEAEKMTNEHFDVLVDLDCTAPIRKVSDVLSCVKMLEENNADNVVTGCKSRKSPFFNMVKINNQGICELVDSSFSNVSRRQDAPKTFDMNASIYVWQRQKLLDEDRLFLNKTLFYEMPKETSFDIDSDLDFKLVTAIFHSSFNLD
jgi:CMP-N,N'-diacetyllegionaminic acid synthase